MRFDRGVWRALTEVLAWAAILVSFGISASLGPKPTTLLPESGDAHIGEGVQAELNDSQYGRLQDLMKKQGYVTRQQLQLIVDDPGKDPFR